MNVYQVVGEEILPEKISKRRRRGIMKEEFIELLRSTKREGIEELFNL